MSIQKLQEKIRKLKNPSVISFDILQKHIPPHLLEQEGKLSDAYGRFCAELLEGLKGTIPAVRFSYDTFALSGENGLRMLLKVMKFAKSCGYYVMLDSVQSLSAQSAEFAASMLLDAEQKLPFDALCISSYIGSDGIKPYLTAVRDQDKDLFATVRTANRSAPELQDLLTGSRLVYTATADMVYHIGEPFVMRGGYSHVAGIGAATSADCLRTLRSKYPAMFLLVDGYENPGANAKNCSEAFDRIGHGAVVCAGSSVTAAWMAQDGDEDEYVALAVKAAERMKRNLLRYVEIL